MNIIFSIDSTATSVGMVKEIWVMYVAVVVTVVTMLTVAKPINVFIARHPAFKLLALFFLVLIGFSLLSQGFGVDITNTYIYFSMAFCLLIAFLQTRLTKKADDPVSTHEHYRDGEDRLSKEVF